MLTVFFCIRYMSVLAVVAVLLFVLRLLAAVGIVRASVKTGVSWLASDLGWQLVSPKVPNWECLREAGSFDYRYAPTCNGCLKSEATY